VGGAALGEKILDAALDCFEGKSGSSNKKPRLPVLIPGADTWQTTKHIQDAITMNAAWAVLTRADHPASTSSRRWISTDARCKGISSKSSWCDEYPFFTSLEGGPGASLKIVPAFEQQRQGGKLSRFYGKCKVAKGTKYFVAPTILAPVTTWRC
jgi:hypothetical protein